MKQDVTAANIIPVLLLVWGLEPTPEPFRLQGDKLCLTINYNNYIEFINNCLGDANVLYSKASVLHAAIEQSNTEVLYQNFYKDVSFAIIKELYFAETRSADATRIMHVNGSDVNAKRVSLNEVDEFYSGLSQTVINMFCNEIEKRDFPIPTSFRERNAILWKYALYLYTVSMVPGYYVTVDF